MEVIITHCDICASDNYCVELFYKGEHIYICNHCLLKMSIAIRDYVVELENER